MSDLTPLEKRKFERLFEMGDGYVLDFTNRTMDEFVTDAIGRNIYDPKYDYGSGSKANRIRGFWQVEQNYIVGKLLSSLIDYQKVVEEEAQASGNHFRMKKPEELQQKAALREECRRIVARLLQGQPVPELEALTAVSNERDFEVVSRAVRHAIERNEPESALDRLHTFVVKYIRTLCKDRGIVVTREKPLHSLFGEYVKSIQGGGLIESEMTLRILKSSISTLEAFNDVRNNRSLAHDNPVLNYDEALLIFNHVASSVRFLSTLQQKFEAMNGKQEPKAVSQAVDDTPF